MLAQLTVGVKVICAFVWDMWVPLSDIVEFVKESVAPVVGRAVRY
jgi:hypothetical protein